MKMHLIMAAALVAVSSHAALAASEGGDTWSELQPRPMADTQRLPAVATTASLSVLQRDHPSVYGTPADARSADRTVQLGPDSHWLNVGYGESVLFVGSGGDGAERSFAWRFDVSPAVSAVDLSEVAPADFPDHNVRVFVTEDPRYSGD
jgi:Heavy-metal resistance protein CzcE